MKTLLLALLFVSLSAGAQQINPSQINPPVLPLSGGTMTGSLVGPSAFFSNIESIQYADQYLTSSTTCGIQEAYNALPTSGGKLVPANTNVHPCTATAGLPIVISKPVVIAGHGRGGLSNSTSFDAYTAGTILQNDTASSDFFQVAPAASNILEGITFKDFMIVGNKSVGGATAGNDITINGGSVGIRNVIFDNVTLVDAKGCGLAINDTSYMVQVNDSSMYRNGGAGGICVASPNGGVPSQIKLNGVVSDLNTGDALNINGAQVQDITAYRSTFADSVNGVNVVAGSVNSSFICEGGCDFEKNSNAGALFSDGYGHAIRDSHFPADSAQLYGVYANFPSGANFNQNQLTLDNNNFGANVTRDVEITSTAHVITVLPQASNAYTITDASGNANVFNAGAGVMLLPLNLETNVLQGETADLVFKQRSGGTYEAVFETSSGVPNATVDGSGNIATPGNISAGSGTNVIYRCVTAGATLPIGSLTITAADCGSTADTGMRGK